VTRRRSAVSATLVLTAVGALSLSSCATFNRNNVAARVGTHSITPSAARALVTPDDQHTSGDLLRQQLTAWIKLDVLDEQQAKATYEKGVSGSPSVCLAAIPVATLDATTQVLNALQSGVSFADAARQFSGNPALASSGGIVPAPDGSECMAPSALAPAVSAALQTTPVGQPIAANLGTFSAVLLLRPYDELSFQSRAAVTAASVSQEQLAVSLADANIYVDPRYGRWDPTTLSVVPLSS
jgi:hypothetical protein